MSGPSHALHLALKLAGFEAAHSGSALITKDHLFLGLLKLVDVGLRDYLSELSQAEQLATTGEVQSLRGAFGGIDTTRLRRALRARVSHHERTLEDAAPRPRPSRECEKLLAQVGSTIAGWGCLGLLGMLLESPGKETKAQLAEDGIDPCVLLANAGSLSGQDETAGLARAVALLHRQWRALGGDAAPDISDLWRRIAPNAVIEFDGNGGLGIMQGSHCLLRLDGRQSKSRVLLLGQSLAQSISEFEEGVVTPCKAPLAEF